MGLKPLIFPFIISQLKQTAINGSFIYENSYLDFSLNRICYII